MSFTADPKNVIGSIIKASNLLNLFTVGRRKVSLSEFASETGYNKTTVYRILQTLVLAGWLVREPAGTYRLGNRALVLGAVARLDLDLRNEAAPFMRRLAEEFGDTAFLMVPDEQGAVTIETVVGRNPVRVHGVTVGAVLPYHVAAGPVVLAAFSPSLEAQVLAGDLPRITQRTQTSPSALRARFAKTRDTGWSVSVEDYLDDVSAVAAPILDADGIAIASLSLGGPANHFNPPALDRMIERVTTYAREISARIKHGEA